MGSTSIPGPIAIKFLGMRFAGAYILTSAVLMAQSGPPPQQLYEQVRARVLNDVSRIPNFTCVQTITRRVYATAVPNRRPPNCDEIVRSHNAGKHNQPLVSWDRLRLDVAIADKDEVFSWVGAAKFDTGDLRELVGGGQTEIGYFGGFLSSVFNDHLFMQFQRMLAVHGRRLLEYSYETPLEDSHYQLRVGSDSALYTTAYAGAAFLDPSTHDLVRLTSNSAPLPEDTGYCQITGDLEYSRLRIGATETLIPKRATSWAIDRTGGAFASVAEYSNCREYVGESVISFDEPAASEPSAVSATNNAVAPTVIPAGLPFSCTIVTPINSDTAAAGDPIEALVRSPITNVSGRILAPAGTRIYGRLRAFIEYPASRGRRQSYEIGIQLRYIEMGGKRVPFRARLAGESRKDGAWLRIPRSSQYGTFVFIKNKLHLTSLDSNWVTAPVAITAAAR
jgi:hypothetical protein